MKRKGKMQSDEDRATVPVGICLPSEHD